MNLTNISKSSSVFPQGGFLPIPYPNQHLRVLKVAACGTIRLYHLILQYAAFTILHKIDNSKACVLRVNATYTSSDTVYEHAQRESGPGGMRGSG